MSQEITSENNLSPSSVKAAFDEILATEITSLIEIDSESALLTYNLATLSCVLIGVEREREVKMFSDSPPERFTRQTFLEEMVDIGLEDDETLVKALDSVIEQGYIRILDAGKLKAEVVAYTMVGFLDTIFPGMQGMNLIAFVLQMSDEVLSGRKTLEVAKKSFAQTLKSRGVTVTRKKAEEKASELAKVSSSALPGAARKLKEANKKRLSGFKLKKTDKKPSVYSSEGYTPEKVKIKTLFDKDDEPGKETIEEAEERLNQARLKAEELEALESKIQEAEEKAKELESREMELKAAQEAFKEAEQKALEMRAREAEMALREAGLKAMEEKLKADSEEKPSKDDPVDDIESQIAAFEAELAMPCPVCGKGRIIEEKTSKGRDYYTCNNNDCRFVSWEKPYHFSCPLCKNTYLTEIQLPSGGQGLKCPRAACSFSQDGIADPALTVAKMESGPKKIKKKVVRRVKRRS